MASWKEVRGRDPEIIRNPEKILVPEKIIFIDLNRTLLEPDGKPTPGSETVLIEAITSTTQEGIAVGLNSDSPLPPLWRLAQKLGMNGPIFAENGTLYYEPQTDTVYALLQIPDIEKVRSELVAQLTDKGLFIFPPLVSPEFGEPNEITGIEGQEGIAFGRYRMCTITIFGLKREGDSLIPNAKATMKTAEWLTGRLADGVALYHDPSTAYIAIHPLYPGQTTYQPNKALGVGQLLTFNPWAKIFKIGDDERDLQYGIGEDHIFTGMVANAQNQWKEQADYVAQQPFTVGTIELIHHAVKLLKG